MSDSVTNIKTNPTSPLVKKKIGKKTTKKTQNETTVACVISSRKRSQLEIKKSQKSILMRRFDDI